MNEKLECTLGEVGSLLLSRPKEWQPGVTRESRRSHIGEHALYHYWERCSLGRHERATQKSQNLPILYSMCYCYSLIDTEKRSLRLPS